MVKTRPTIIGVVVASVVAVATVHWPYRLGLLAAMLIGIAAAVISEQAVSGEGDR